MKGFSDVISLKQQLEKKIGRLSKDTHYIAHVEGAERKIGELRKRLEFTNVLLAHWNMYQWLLEDSTMDSFVLDI